jgi:uncharacterized protein YecT (DUF1311 family)
MTPRNRIYICHAAALLISASGFADSPRSDSCASPRGTIEVNRCAQQEFDAQDDLLNETYQKVLWQLDTDYQRPTREKLITARRLWIQFRDADCSAQESLYDGGTAHTAARLACLRDHTVQRIKDLTPSKWQGG